MINNIFSICQTISQEMHNNNYTNAYNEFVKLLDSIISFTTVRRNFLRQGFNCLTSITYKAQNIFRLELRNFAVGNKTPSASHEQRKNNLRANYVPH